MKVTFSKFTALYKSSDPLEGLDFSLKMEGDLQAMEANST
jgi:hypothetical protein